MMIIIINLLLLLLLSNHKVLLCADAASLHALRAKLSGAVYCNRSYLWVCMFAGLLPTYHDNSKLRASIFTKLGLY